MANRMEVNRVVGVLTLVSGQPGGISPGISDGDLSLQAAVAMFVSLVNSAL